MVRPEGREGDALEGCSEEADALSRSPCSAEIIETLIRRHRGVLERLAKMESQQPEAETEKAADDRSVARMLVARHRDALQRLAKH